MSEGIRAAFEDHVHGLPDEVPMFRPGWRLWFYSPGRRGQLLNPFTPTPLHRHDPTGPDTSTITTRCPHGNDAPSDRCRCGLYLFSSLDHLPEPPAGFFLAATHGYSLGRVLPDFGTDERWSRSAPLRAAGYQMTHLVIDPAIPLTDGAALIHRYDLPLYRGLTPERFHQIEQDPIHYFTRPGQRKRRTR